MSTDSEDATQTDYTPLEELTPGRLRVAKTIEYLVGPATFERPNLKDMAEATDDLDEVIDDPERVLTSLKYTTLLNELVYDGYLVKEYQGGKNPIILDLNYDEDRDNIRVAPYGNTSKLWTIAVQVLDRNGLGTGYLSDVDRDDFNAVRDAVNRALSRTVLVTVSEASEYRFTKEAYPTVAKKTKEVLEDK